MLCVYCAPCSRGAQLLKWPREQLDHWGPWFLFWLFVGALGGRGGEQGGVAASIRTCRLQAVACRTWTGVSLPRRCALCCGLPGLGGGLWELAQQCCWLPLLFVWASATPAFVPRRFAPSLPCPPSLLQPPWN